MLCFAQISLVDKSDSVLRLTLLAAQSTCFLFVFSESVSMGFFFTFAVISASGSTQWAFTCSKLIIETLEQGVKYVRFCNRLCNLVYSSLEPEASSSLSIFLLSFSSKSLNTTRTSFCVAQNPISFKTFKLLDNKFHALPFSVVVGLN